MSADAGQMLSHYINKNQDVDKGLENARQDLKSALEMFPDDETLKELSAILQKDNNEIAESSNEAYRYDVDIPDDNGENYLGWNESQNFPLENGTDFGKLPIMVLVITIISKMVERDMIKIG